MENIVQPPVSFIAVLIWTASLLGVSYTNVYTSSQKIQDMIELEEYMLNKLQTAVENLGNVTALSCFSRFYLDRMQRVKERNNNNAVQFNLEHPNGIYHIIKQFAAEYENIRSVLEPASPDVQKHLSSIADQTDVRGAILSLMRLQTVYNLKPSDMIKGNYLGVVGPELSDIDALEIGEVAFKEGQFVSAVEWLQEALAKLRSKEPSAGYSDPDHRVDLTGRTYALLGRCYLRQGDQVKAADMYRIAHVHDPTNVHVLELQRELESKPESQNVKDVNINLIRLCSLRNKLAQNKFDPRLKCSYKVVILPYFRFKQELVSVSPYVVLFYDVITDKEGDNITDFVKDYLERGRTESLYNYTSIITEIRTSDLTFVYDFESPTVDRLSKRIGAITNLDTRPHVEGRDYSGEPLQVVNYGIGGHYAVHFDPLAQKSLERDIMQTKKIYGGNRLATFLIYLSDVEKGGSTVFTVADIAVSPVKNMALFWYNYKPSGERDDLTLHAGCPVVIGHKWVANKWIWQYGNTFNRRCGLTPDATQLDIDKYMRRGWA